MIRIRQATAEGYIEIPNNGVCDLSYPESKTRRGRVQGGGKICPTLMATQADVVKISIYETTKNMKPYTFTVIDKDGKEKQCVALIRKLTPTECFTLMGCDKKTTDILTDKEKTHVSSSQQFKQAGNSICVDVLYELFRKMWIEPKNESQQMSIFDML